MNWRRESALCFVLLAVWAVVFIGGEVLKFEPCPGKPLCWKRTAP